jgi:hypothetical protein
VRSDVLLLLGSGFSRAAGYPSVEDLTHRVLSRTGPTPSIEDLRTAAWALLEGFAKRYLSRSANYEDLAYLLRQIEDLDTSEVENPAAEAILNQLAERLRAAPTDVARDAKSLHSLVRKDVQDWLWPPESRGTAEYPHLVADLVAPRLAALVTTNHDLLLEQNIPRFWEWFSDGFRAEGGEGPGVWADTFSPDRVPFVKLHGSVDWWIARLQRGAGVQQATVVTLHGCAMDESRLLRTGIHVDGEALIVGTFNKAMDYHRGVWADLYWWFEALLRRSRRVVVVGYGFGDQALNSALIRWMAKDDERQLFVGDLDPVAMLQRARAAARRQLAFWKERVTLHAGSASAPSMAAALSEFLST